MGRPRKYSDELRRRAIDEVLERGRKVQMWLAGFSVRFRW